MRPFDQITEADSMLHGGDTGETALKGRREAEQYYTGLHSSLTAMNRGVQHHGQLGRQCGLPSVHRN